MAMGLGVAIGIGRNLKAGTNVSGGGGDVTAPTITSTNTATVAENATLSKSLTADETVTWSISGGADAAHFEISGSTLRWVSNGTKDYDVAGDANADNVYVVNVVATDTALNPSSVQTISVTLTDVADGPVNTVAPAITGTPTVGQTLTTTDGTWTGTPTPTLARKWQADTAGNGTFADIGGATASTYLLTSGEQGDKVRVVVTGTNTAAPAGVAANSNQTATIAAAGGGGSAESTVVISAMTAAGSTPDSTREALIRTLVDALVTAGVWAKLDIFYCFRAHSSSVAFLDWKGRSNATQMVGGTFTIDRGWAGNGTTQYLNSGFNPTTAVTPVYTQNNAHFGFWTNTTGAGANVDMGADAGAYLSSLSSSNNQTRGMIHVASAGNYGTAGASTVNQHYVITRSASNAFVIYRSAVSHGSGSTASSAPNNSSFTIGRGAATAFSARQYSFAHIGSNLTAQNVTDLYNALNAYITGTP